jgi:hypothetical protein
LDEGNCTEIAECSTEPALLCSPDGCTVTLVACFIEGDPTLVQGGVAIAVHEEDGAPCEGSVPCTVFYDLEGERLSGSRSPAVASGNPWATSPETPDRSVARKALEAILAGARALLERILPGF